MDLQAHRQRLRCSVSRVDDIFPGCMEEATKLLSPDGIEAYLDGASTLCNLGRGQELPIIFLENMPLVARIAGERIIPEVVEMAQLLSGAGSPKAIAPFLDKLPACARRLETTELLGAYFGLVKRLAQEAPGGLVPFLQVVDYLLGQICIGSVKSWVEYGLRTYRGQPHRVGDYFSLQSADARAALQRERKGTLLADHERKLRLYLRAFWGLEEDFQPYSLAFDILRKPFPHLDKLGFHVPDVYEDLEIATPAPPFERGRMAGQGDTIRIAGIDRYRATLAHLAAHRLYTRPFIADNFNLYQQMLIETFEDARVEHIAMERFPGLRRLWMALHPVPREGDCPPGHSCIRHKAAMLSRALLDPDHPYADPVLRDHVDRFRERVARDPFDTKIAVDLGVEYLVKIHHADFRSPKMFFKDTEVSYRDDNRYMWIFLEDTDDEDDFHSDHNVFNPKQSEPEGGPLFARHQPEWDYEAQYYRPDWVTVVESVQSTGDAAHIDGLLEKNAQAAKKIRRVVDMLKPQQHARVRYQEDGAELDLDVAIRSMVDFRSGSAPDPRIHFSHTHDGRDISVMLLLDLSQSVNERPSGLETTILELSREAVTLLAWAVDAMGDPFAIAGFSSNTRHDVRYFHFKGFGEEWGNEVKGRLAGMQGGFSTRMGAALRHAGYYLGKRGSAKKLLLVLTDGEPADIDVDDPAYLRADARKAVEELSSKGVASYCITLDPNADEYVADIFGKNGYAVIDHIDKLPEQLPRLFMALTR
jgi:nitric oxide reductase NorD protein